MHRSVTLPLFSSPVGIYKLQKDFDLHVNYEFKPLLSSVVADSYITCRKDILNDYIDLKNMIMECFNDYKNSVFEYAYTDFKITTSWMTKVEPNNFSEFHKHSNSMFSAVYYFDTSEEIAPLQFKYNNVLSNFGLNVRKENIYNQDVQSIRPEKNYLIFFPSHLEHRIGLHKGEKTRYSLACNFFPTGEIGREDSYVNLLVQ